MLTSADMIFIMSVCGMYLYQIVTCFKFSDINFWIRWLSTSITPKWWREACRLEVLDAPRFQLHAFHPTTIRHQTHYREGDYTIACAKNWTLECCLFLYPLCWHTYFCIYIYHLLRLHMYFAQWYVCLH